jgi:RHH-type proline utilization regulon transcriptional repressor/proline dehydrogenase/delta 1-pyrroline-5-carboxylate dehydrogenase
MSVDEAIFQLGSELRQKMSGETPGLFQKDYWQGRIMEWAMKDPSFKVDMFRFVDVLPVLENKDQVSRHIKEYLLKDGRELPSVMSAALKAASGKLTAGLGAAAMKNQVTDMARRFIVGEDAKQATKVLKKLHKDGIAFTVDLLGEATVSEGESDVYRDRYVDLIDGLAKECMPWKADEVIDTNHLGLIPRVNVSLKISAMYSQINAIDPAGSVARLKERVLPLFLRAKEQNVFLNVDLEQWAYHDITYDLFEEILSHPELRSHPHVGIVVQAYLKHSPKDVDRLLSLAKNRGAPITVRLVKGAYWDYETVQARQHGHDCPVFTDKAETDANYEALSAKMLDNIDHLLPAFGSHNLRSVTNALVLAKEKKVPDRSYEVQMLYGMAEPERKVMRGLGHRVRVYAPVGEMLPGMAYLVRRLLENTSNSGFLRLSHVEHVDERELLGPPQLGDDKALAPSAMVRGDLSSPFDSCPLLDWTERENIQKMEAAVAEVEATLPGIVPVIVDGEARSSGDDIDERPRPSETDKLAARVVHATVDEAERAVQSAHKAWPAWRDRPLEERAAMLEKLADLIEEDRFRMAAVQMFEVGKPWSQADGDIAEAVDFCRYYARRALLELGPQKQGDKEGEDNQLHYEGRGVSVIIAPWNFPLAILCGMTTAALVSGNSVVMKPAEQSSLVSQGLYEKMIEAGFPADVVQFLPGKGETVGAHLVDHPLTAQIAFTGSKAVGLHIVKAAADTKPGQPQVKRVVCEMGGKNAVIVDDDADLDEAVHGVVYSAFGFSGQKCSACSRVLVVGSAYEAFTKRLVEATRSILVGKAQEAGTYVGPVVDAEAHERLMALVNDPGVDVLFKGDAPGGGYFVPPTIVACQDRDHRVMQDEFFGPFLAVMKVDSFDQGLEVALSTEFALTGAVFSRSPANLDKARKAFRVGNLYLNQGSTGALVGRQPFGGFAMSGVGTKAGGPHYLLHFADPRLVTENTMRRGFTPDLES